MSYQNNLHKVLYKTKTKQNKTKITANTEKEPAESEELSQVCVIIS